MRSQPVPACSIPAMQFQHSPALPPSTSPAYRRRHEPPDEACCRHCAHVAANDEVPSGAARGGNKKARGGNKSAAAVRGVQHPAGCPQGARRQRRGEHTQVRPALRLLQIAGRGGHAPGKATATSTAAKCQFSRPPDEQPAVHNALVRPPRPPPHDIPCRRAQARLLGSSLGHERQDQEQLVRGTGCPAAVQTAPSIQGSCHGHVAAHHLGG